MVLAARARLRSSEIPVSFTISKHGLVRRSELGIRFALVGVKRASPRVRTREAEADRRVVVVTVYREEAFVGDLPE